MIRNLKEIYQFKISLNNSKPPIWRRILVPSNYTFWDFHCAIQDAMGWLDYHLHSFELINPKTNRKVEIGSPEEASGGLGGFDMFSKPVLSEDTEKISKYFNEDNPNARYEYDFGDSWIHTIKLEKILPVEKGLKYPRCIAGKMACPPEDCGGLWGYYNYLEVLKNPKHEDYAEMRDWMGGSFDPVYFNPGDIVFDDPKLKGEQRFTDD